MFDNASALLVMRVQVYLSSRNATSLGVSTVTFGLVCTYKIAVSLLLQLVVAVAPLLTDLCVTKSPLAFRAMVPDTRAFTPRGQQNSSIGLSVYSRWLLRLRFTQGAEE